MLIVCPNCATSYMIDPASVGPSGRAVRCARCKSTWFAGASKSTPNVSAFVDGVIAEAQAESAGAYPDPTAAPQGDTPPPPAAIDQAALDQAAQADDFGGDPADKFPPASDTEFAPPAFDEATRNTDLAPRPDEPHDEHAGLAVTNAPSLVPPIEHYGPHHDPHDGPPFGEPDPEEADSYVARRARLKARRQQSKRTSRWTAVILVLFAFNVALIGARSEVVRYLPQTASLFAAVGLPVNLRNLKFDKVRIVKEAQDGVNILIVEGVIANTANKPTEVPRLRFSARNATGQEVYTWTALPRRSLLGPNETVEFQSRLAAPPADATDVMVRFFNAQDAASGAK
ncbi:MAG: DUF3426 domain-containing protein [Pseudolabrys sp.]|nr:DUF3426 domain-containing protein [Pseudolabrys sp.]MDP2298301.1 DUF3426 domain-containing protein [Pseudolabrys sp.]